MSQPEIAFGRPLPDLEHFDAAAFLAAVSWKKRADRALARAAGQGDLREFTRRLRKLFQGANRRNRPLPEQHSPDGHHEANGRSAESDPIRDLRQSLDLLCDPAACGKHAQLFAAWQSTLVSAIELSFANGWPPAQQVDGEADSRQAATDVTALIRHGELPWAVGLVFGDVAGSGPVRKAGWRQLRAALRQYTEADGTPRTGLPGDLPDWFSVLVRSAEWGEAFGQRLWRGADRDRFEKLTRSVAVLCDRKGIFGGRVTSNGEPEPGGGGGGVAEPLQSAARIAGWKKRGPAARLVRALTNGAVSRRPRTGPADRPQRDRGRYPSIQSDASRLACLRTDWSVDADVLVLAHAAAVPELRLSIFGTPLLWGSWTIDVAVDGQPVELGEAWSCVCWSSDGDGDYIELQQRLPNGLRIERQALLAREDRLLVLADAVSGAGEARIDYAARLPLVEAAQATADRQTRECRLRIDRLAARVFPLALPDDRIQSTPGSFGPAGEALELKQTARGGLYAPVVLDWNPRRRRGDADWRTLTVAEDLRRVTPAEAWAHRLRIADFQLLVYRSLTGTRPLRTVLGQHTANETLMGRFDEEGEVEAYVMVE
jgi:hypothetical protein